MSLERNNFLKEEDLIEVCMLVTQQDGISWQVQMLLDGLLIEAVKKNDSCAIKNLENELRIAFLKCLEREDSQSE